MKVKFIELIFIITLLITGNMNAQVVETPDVKGVEGVEVIKVPEAEEGINESLVELPKSGKEFQSSSGYYQITFPDNWDIKDQFMGMDVIGLSEIEGSEDQFRENANVIFADLDQSISKEDYYDQNITLLEKLLTDYKLQDEGVTDVDGVESKWIRYNHKMGEIEATVQQYLILDNNRAYVITFTANPDDFQKYERVFNAILKSFKFKK